MERILPLLTEQEEAIFRRGRNIGHTNTPKHATVAEYRAATGFEAVLGALYHVGETERLYTLLDTIHQNEFKEKDDTLQ